LARNGRKDSAITADKKTHQIFVKTAQRKFNRLRWAFSPRPKNSRKVCATCGGVFCPFTDMDYIGVFQKRCQKRFKKFVQIATTTFALFFSRYMRDIFRAEARGNL
jgi:capsid portal protein